MRDPPIPDFALRAHPGYGHFSTRLGSHSDSAGT
jgi:hypothetical protein